MSNNRSSQEELMNSYLKLVGEEYAKIVSEEFDEIAEVDEYPENLDRWFSEYNKKNKNRQKRKKLATNSYKYMRRIVAVFVAVLIVSAVITLNVEALRIEFLTFFINENSDNIHIQTESIEQRETILDDYHELYVLGYIPEGFVIDNILDMELDVKLTYTYQDMRITFTQHKGEADINIDNERSNIKEYTLSNGEISILSKDNNYGSIVWENDTYTFIIYGNVDEKTIIKMAENIIWKK